VFGKKREAGEEERGRRWRPLPSSEAVENHIQRLKERRQQQCGRGRRRREKGRAGKERERAKARIYLLLLLVWWLLYF
jgi:hypothetical protein